MAKVLDFPVVKSYLDKFKGQAPEELISAFNRVDNLRLQMPHPKMAPGDKEKMDRYIASLLGEILKLEGELYCIRNGLKPLNL